MERLRIKIRNFHLIVFRVCFVKLLPSKYPIRELHFGLEKYQSSDSSTYTSIPKPVPSNLLYLLDATNGFILDI